MTTETSFSAQVLLKQHFSFQGYIEQQTSLVGTKKWIKTFIIIFKDSIYMYSDKNSKKPKMVVVLSAYRDYNVSTDPKNPSKWILILKSSSTDNEIEDLKFRYNDKDKIEEVRDILKGIILRVDIHSNRQSLSSNSLNLSMRIPDNIGNDTENEYESTENQFHNSFRSQRSYLPEIPDLNQSTTLSNNISMNSDYDDPNNTGIILETSPINQHSITDLSTYADISQNEENYFFRGTSSEAYQELQRNIVHESFLIRQDVDNRKVLTVQCRNEVIKYNLDIDPETNKIKIRNQNKTFYNLEGLINYYRENNIPGSFCKLRIPYKLR